MPRDLNYGARDVLKPIMLAHRARGDSAARLLAALIVAISVPVSVHVKRVPIEKERDHGME